MCWVGGVSLDVTGFEAGSGAHDCRTLLDKQRRALPLRGIDAAVQPCVGEYKAREHEEPRYPSEAPAEEIDPTDLATEGPLLGQVTEHDVDGGEQAHRVEAEEALWIGLGRP